jgi:hypothetical protein
MSAPAPLPTRTECVTAFGAAVASARGEMARRYAEGGAVAVARAACPDGTPQRLAELAAQYEGLVAETRAKGKRAASAA